jgi:hypothetical protein
VGKKEKKKNVRQRVYSHLSAPEKKSINHTQNYLPKIDSSIYLRWIQFTSISHSSFAIVDATIAAPGGHIAARDPGCSSASPSPGPFWAGLR